MRLRARLARAGTAVLAAIPLVILGPAAAGSHAATRSVPAAPSRICRLMFAVESRPSLMHAPSLRFGP